MSPGFASYSILCFIYCVIVFSKLFLHVLLWCFLEGVSFSRFYSIAWQAIFPVVLHLLLYGVVFCMLGHDTKNDFV